MRGHVKNLHIVSSSPSRLARAATIAVTLATLARADRADAACPTESCGANSPYLNLLGTTVAIDELSLDGLASDEGVRLDPTSLVAPHCGGAPLRLEIEAGRLIGVAPSGERCGGARLAGATFALTVGGAAVQTIEIADVGRTWAWDRQAQRWRNDLETYTLEALPTGAGADAQPVPLCRLDQPWLDEDNVDDPLVGNDLGQRARGAVLVIGETYDWATARVDQVAVPRWFNFACQGGALAKMRVLGYDPMAGDTTPAQRQATLQMITARYRGDRSYTEQGTRIIWVNRHGPPPRAPLGELEAIWADEGAVIVAAPRACAADPGGTLCQEARAVAGRCSDVPPGEWITYNPLDRFPR
jgi:hypothetical protein